MRIESLQSNNNVVKGGKAESAAVTTASTTDYNTKSAVYAANDIVVISQEARELANKRRADEKALYDKKSNKNPVPVGDLLIMAKRYLDYYLNDSKDLAIKVLDKETKEVVKEIPLKEEQKLRASIEKMVEEMSGEK